MAGSRAHSGATARPRSAGRPGRSFARDHRQSQRRQSVRVLSARRTPAADRGSSAADRAAPLPVTEREGNVRAASPERNVRHQPYRSALSPQPRIHTKEENYEPRTPTPAGIKRAFRRTVATQPDHANPVGSYPDNPRPGTPQPRKRTGGTHNTTGATCAKSPPHSPIRIVRVETIPMTTEEFDNAIEAWAVLLNRYWHEHPEEAA